MLMRKIEFMEGEFYHVFNRGNNKRPIFNKYFDLNRFLLSIQHFNNTDPIGSIYENLFRNKELGGSTSKLDIKSEKLVDIVAYCLNPNHFHFILKQVSINGIQKFMHRLGTGYTMYFNEKYKNSGSLFQGRYKAIHVNSNEYLLHLSAYINLNFEAHYRSESTRKSNLSQSSWEEYTSNKKDSDGLCNKNIILSQFKNMEDYKQFAKDSLEIIKQRKDLQELVLEDIS